MIRFRIIAALMLVLAIAACGGGSNSIEITPESGGAPQLAIFEMGDLPGTVPPEPENSAQLVEHFQKLARQAATKNKSTSAVLSTVTDGFVQVNGSFGDPPATPYYDFEPDPGVPGDVFDAQHPGQLEITGTFTPSADGWERRFAQVGLVTEAVYQFAMDPNGDGDQSDARPAYMFNQNVMMLYALDPATGSPFVAPFDYNNRLGVGTMQPLAPGTPFSFNLRLTPDASGLGGDAELSIDGAPFGPSHHYGKNNWSWWPEEDFSQARLIVQIYSYSSDPTPARIDFTSTQVEGPVAGGIPHPWGRYGHDTLNTHRSPYIGPQTRTVQWWSASLGGIIESSPAIGADGTIYVGSNAGRLYAIDPDTGLLLWQTNATGASISSSPAIGTDGTIFVGSQDGNVYAFYPDSSTKWQMPTGASVTSSPVLGPDGTVFIGSQDGQLYAFDPDDGTQIWATLPVPGIFDSGLALSSGGALYSGCSDGSVYAFDSTDGSLIWITVPIAVVNPIDGINYVTSPAVAADGTIYYTCGDGRMRAYSPLDGSELWATPAAPAAILSSPAIAADGTIYVGHEFGTVSAHNPADGSQAWLSISSFSAHIISSLAVGGDGTIYGHSAHFSSSVPFALNPADGTTKWIGLPTNVVNYSCPSIGPNGTLYFGTQNHTVLAIGDGAGGTPTIDCTALTNANFALRSALDNSFLTANLSTNSTYNASGDLALGDTFYVSFSENTVSQPSDTELYPEVPASGYVTYSASGFIMTGDIADYFDVTGGGFTLELETGAYNRVTNDLDALRWADYSLIDASPPDLVITGPHDTNTSAADTVVLARGVKYRPLLETISYPDSSDQVIYPDQMIQGYIEVGSGALTEGGTVLGDFYDQAGLVNTLQSDAYCRIESDASLIGTAYGFMNTGTNSWIVAPAPGYLDPGSDPFDGLVFARGTQFAVRDLGGFMSPSATVTAGQQLDAGGGPLDSITLALGSSSVTLNVMPVRVWDDLTASDPDANVTPDIAGWDVDINFMLQYGLAPYTVEIDADWGSAWDDGAANRTYTLASSPFAATGFISDTVTVSRYNQSQGTYTFAIRVTDANGDQDVYVWSTGVNLPLQGWTVSIPHPDSAGSVGRHTSMAMVGGLPAIAYYDFFNQEPKFVRALDINGGTWGAPVTIEVTPGLTDIGWDISLAVIDGNPAISCYNIRSRDLMYERAIDALGTDWATAMTTVHSGGSVGQYSSLVELPTNNPGISYYDASGRLRYAYYDAGAWHLVTATTGGSSNVGQYSSIKMVDGFPAIAYLNASSGQVLYIRATNAIGSAWGTVRTVDNGGPDYIGWYTNLEVVNGNPAVAYYNWTQGALEYQRATDTTGHTATSWSGIEVVLDTANDTGHYPSLEVINGNPAISYWELTNDDLKYVRATDADGATWGAPELVDFIGNVGDYSSLMLVNGQPGISYYDETNLDLKFIRYYP